MPAVQTPVKNRNAPILRGVGQWVPVVEVVAVAVVAVIDFVPMVVVPVVVVVVESGTVIVAVAVVVVLVAPVSTLAVSVFALSSFLHPKVKTDRSNSAHRARTTNLFIRRSPSSDSPGGTEKDER